MQPMLMEAPTLVGPGGVGKMRDSKKPKTIKVALLILLTCLAIPFLLNFLRKIEFHQTIWMTIIIVSLCIIIIYTLLKIK